MLHWLYDSDLLRGHELGGGVFVGVKSLAPRLVRIHQFFIVFGGKDSIPIGPILAVAAVKLTFIISQHPKNR